MQRSKKLLLIFELLLSATTVFSQPIVKSIKHFKEIEIPDSNKVLKYQNSSTWNVSKVNNQLFCTRNPKSRLRLPFSVTLSSQSYGKEKIYKNYIFRKVDDGYLVSIFGGTLGIGLYWFSRDGKANYRISTPIIRFEQGLDSLYVLFGFRDGGSSVGAIGTLERIKDKWRITNTLKLSNFVYAFTVDEKRNFLTVSENKIISVGYNKIETYVCDISPLGMLTPTSIILLNNSIYIGMKYGIFKYNFSTNKKSWLTNK